MSVKTAVTLNLVLVLVAVCGTWLVHVRITAPPDPAPPCTEVLHRVRSDSAAEARCSPGAWLEKIDVESFVCRCPGAQEQHVEGPSRE